MVAQIILEKLLRENGLKPITLKKSDLENSKPIEINPIENIDGTVTIQFREAK